MPNIWETDVIFKTIAGSQLYGTSTPESDVDIRGVCHQTPESLLGLSPFEQFQQDEPDLTIFGLNKFCSLAADCNPNIIEILFAPTSGPTCLHTSPVWQKLLDIRHAFVSRKAFHTFAGYAYSQLERINRHHRWLILKETPVDPNPRDFGARPTDDTSGNNNWHWDNHQDKNAYQNAREKFRQYTHWLEERNPARKELEEKFGYDTKHGMHLCRIMLQGMELLETGRMTFPSPDARWLMEVRNGLFTYGRIVEWASQMQAEMKSIEKTCLLPFGPDRKLIEQAVMQINLDFIQSRF